MQMVQNEVAIKSQARNQMTAIISHKVRLVDSRCCDLLIRLSFISLLW